MAKKWIQGADIKEGAFTKKAKAKGKGVQQFAQEVTSGAVKASPKTKKQAALAETFAKMSKGRKGK